MAADSSDDKMILRIKTEQQNPPDNQLTFVTLNHLVSTSVRLTLHAARRSMTKGVRKFALTFIRANRPPDKDGNHVNNALDILEAPWPRREEIMLRDWYNDPNRNGLDKARSLVARIRDAGLEPFVQPKLLPPIELDDIELVCWMGIQAEPSQIAPAHGVDW